ncbi:uncharacterized protein OCT59_001326 [Rhizophagus irregularis]|uniref:uncharacterized protein n=1 Tax=Rhizophagus irregularis TaxID=588596 RepID=UPI0019F8DAA9|nr:hypothetical protein OCT59_001326 [Rhizophagus irregularis]GET61316.1 hypothetical protein RIR_jg27968.t1 [Rhizophagus irregularis DAOM 181602=DAOM 197198]
MSKLPKGQVGVIEYQRYRYHVYHVDTAKGPGKSVTLIAYIPYLGVEYLKFKETRLRGKTNIPNAYNKIPLLSHTQMTQFKNIISNEIYGTFISYIWQQLK